MRTTLDGRIVVGGEDESFSDETKRDALIPTKIDAILSKLAKLMPGVATEPEFAWAGCFGSSPTGLPAIGPFPAPSTALRCSTMAGTASPSVPLRRR